tara:strand:- start:140 stop:832 length:693 start_codon:yes stop_codon:yes gene_type:complete
MRYFYLADNKDRDATVMAVTVKSSPNPVMSFNSKKINSVRILETSEGKTYSNLKSEHGDNLVDTVCTSDIDIDLIQTGLIISTTSRTYLSQQGKLMNQAPRIEEIIFDPEGKEKKRGIPKNIEPNVRDDTPPIKWSGKAYKKEEAIRKFVFQRTVQLQHTNGLTYDFLYEMAKELQDKEELMFVGAGTKGIDPLIFQFNGTPMRGFLEGRVEGSKYQLLMHLSNMEMKLP